MCCVQPGERSGRTVVGKAEVPLSAFLLSKIDPSSETQSPIALKIDVHLQNKVTGTLYVEGIFEPLDTEKDTETETQQALTRTLCRSIGRALSAKAKSARNSGDAALVPQIDRLPGRLEIHFVCARVGESALPADRSLTAHVWLSSRLDVRNEVRSKTERASRSIDGVQDSDVVWDRQLTLYTSDISSELLRIEVLTLT